MLLGSSWGCLFTRQRPGTVDSVMSDRPPTRPYSTNTMLLPRYLTFLPLSCNLDKLWLDSIFILTMKKSTTSWCFLCCSHEPKHHLTNASCVVPTNQNTTWPMLPVLFQRTKTPLDQCFLCCSHEPKHHLTNASSWEDEMSWMTFKFEQKWVEFLHCQ